MKSTDAEVLIRTLTPIALALIGGAVAVTVLVTPGLSDAKWSAGMGLATAAITGAAGLAQTNKSE